MRKGVNYLGINIVDLVLNILPLCLICDFFLRNFVVSFLSVDLLIVSDLMKGDLQDYFHCARKIGQSAGVHVLHVEGPELITTLKGPRSTSEEQLP